MLNEQHYEHLKASALSDDIITERGYCTVESFYDWHYTTTGEYPNKRTTDKNKIPFPGIGFPLYRVGKHPPAAWVLRPDQPRKDNQGHLVKYEYPRGQGNILDALPRFQEGLSDVERPIWITEGAKKADALATAYGAAIAVINENGVWGWRSKGKLVEDIKHIVWEGRSIILAPDGDIRHNKQVYKAIERHARLLLGYGAAEVLICLLPQQKTGPKLGVDDYLSAGHTTGELESHLVELGTVEQHTRVVLMKHPDTKAPLYLPPGYDVLGQQIVRNAPNGPQSFYSGLIAVKETGADLHTGEETITVVWDRFNQLQEASIPRIALSSGVRTSEHLTGAFVHSINAREMSRYLVEFIRENDEALPRVQFTDRLGICGDGVALPAGNVGLPSNTRYTGDPVQVGTDHHAYQRVLQQILGSESSWQATSLIWATFALGLAGPALARLQTSRNPVLMLAGQSTSGKSTLAHFTTGLYGDPLNKPLQIQCGSGSTTPKGIQQTMAVLNGLPLLLDDVHMLMARTPDKFAGLIYDYANGQLYTYGTLDRRTGGGQRIGGTLVMTGEMLPEFAHAGSQRRMLLLNCSQTPPLGAPASSMEGLRRATILDSAWKAGAGTFGHQVCERIWRDWNAFTLEIDALSQDTALKDLQAWRLILAASAATLGHAMDLAGVYIDHTRLMREWAEVYQSGQQEHDPAAETFDRVLMMLGQAESSDNGKYVNGDYVRPSWEWLSYERKLVAARRVGETHWRVFTTSPQWLEIVGPGAIVQFGQSWAKAGLILPHKNGQISIRQFVGRGSWTPHCVLIPDTKFSPYYMESENRDHEDHERS
jgi:hypothetical protein